MTDLEIYKKAFKILSGVCWIRQTTVAQDLWRKAKALVDDHECKKPVPEKILTEFDNPKRGDTYYCLMQFSMWEMAQPDEFVYHKQMSGHTFTYRVARCFRFDKNTSKFKYLKKNEVTDEIKKALNIF